MRTAHARAWPRSNPTAMRVQAALFVWVFLVGNLAALIHAATTTHRRCPEHGELVDDDGTAPAQPPFAAQLPDTGDRSAADEIRSTSEPSSEHHSHCFLGCISHQQTAQAVGPSVAPAPALPAESSVPAAAPPSAHGPELYRTAPKTSPPLA